MLNDFEMKNAQFANVIQCCCLVWRGNEDCLINIRDRLKSPAMQLRDVSKQETTGVNTT